MVNGYGAEVDGAKSRIEEGGRGKDNAAAIKLSQLTPRIKRHEGWTVGNVTKLLEYFAPLFWRIKRGPSLTTTVP